MNTVSVFKLVTIGLPVVGALVLWSIRADSEELNRRLTIALLALTALFGLGLFIFAGEYGCMLAGGEGNCLFDGLASLSLFILSLFFIRLALNLRRDDKEGFILLLLLIAAWAGIGLAENLLVFLIALNAFGYLLYRVHKKNDLPPGFLLTWHEPEDHPK